MAKHKNKIQLMKGEAGFHYLALVVMILLIILAMRLTNHITKPLQDLMDAAEQVKKGNF